MIKLTLILLSFLASTLSIQCLVRYDPKENFRIVSGCNFCLRISMDNEPFKFVCTKDSGDNFEALIEKLQAIAENIEKSPETLKSIESSQIDDMLGGISNEGCENACQGLEFCELNKSDGMIAHCCQRENCFFGEPYDICSEYKYVDLLKSIHEEGIIEAHLHHDEEND